VVLKVGGSLLAWEGLRSRLAQLFAERPGQRFALVVGGGGAADVVRAVDAAHNLGNEKAHALALRALDFTAFALSEILDQSPVVERPSQLPQAWAAGQRPILAPRLLLDHDDRVNAAPLPHDWAVTTDSIAARIAARLHASELVLLKSAPLPPGADLSRAAELELIDPHFLTVARELPRVTYVNLRGSNVEARELVG
jgi:aspartokinase-like uncharacterized kinase